MRTRARIVDAATGLFVEHGYLATTIEAVAERAGVAVQTVYYVFGTKRNLLAGVLDASIAGDADLVAVVERPWVDRLADAEDASAAVTLLVEGAVGIVARAAPIYEVVRCASADPEVSALLEANRRARRADQRHLVEVLAQAGHLGPRIDPSTVADVLYAVLNEEVFALLVTDCGWDVERFRRWATRVVLAELGGA